MRTGVDIDLTRSIVKLIKREKMKVQAAIQGAQVRVSGKKLDDLQRVIALIDEQKFGLPLQHVNFRDGVNRRRGYQRSHARRGFHGICFNVPVSACPFRHVHGRALLRGRRVDVAR